MPDENPQKNIAQEEGDDYSGYFKKSEPQKPAKPAAPISPLQELPATKKFTKRAMYLLIVLIILVATQVILMVKWNQETATIPEGYQLVTPPNQPAHLEPIQ